MVMDWVDDIGAVCVVPAQPDRVVHAAKTGAVGVARLCEAWLARLIHKGACKLPATQQGVSQPIGLVEDGQTVDVVSPEDLTAVVTTVALVILQVIGVIYCRQVSIGEVDGMRVRVVQLSAQAPLVLETHAGLQAVVGVVGYVFL